MWNQSSDTNVLGYKVYFGTVSGQYTNVVVAGNVTNTTIAGIKPGTTYYFSATSYNAAGWESAYSPEISYTVPFITAPLVSATTVPGGFTFKVQATAAASYVVLASTNLINWVALQTNTAPFQFTDVNKAQYSRRFYKAMLESVYLAQVQAAPPLVSPPLTSPGNTPSGFAFTVNRTAGSAYVIEASTNLINWVALATNTAPFTFTDTQSSLFSHRFYKVILASDYVPQISTTPGAAAALSQTVLSSGGFSFALTGTPGAAYVVEASTNLIDWLPLVTNTAPFTFTDPSAALFSQRFYQAVPLP